MVKQTKQMKRRNNTTPFKTPWKKNASPSYTYDTTPNKRPRTQKFNDDEPEEEHIDEDVSTEDQDFTIEEVLDWLLTIDQSIEAMTTQISLLTQQITELGTKKALILESQKPKLTRQDATFSVNDCCC